MEPQWSSQWLRRRCISQRQRSAVENARSTAPRVVSLCQLAFGTCHDDHSRNVQSDLHARRASGWLGFPRFLIAPQTVGHRRRSSASSCITSAFSCFSGTENPCASRSWCEMEWLYRWRCCWLLPSAAVWILRTAI
jgi:hypothetical protein